jgi:hypothetical protein
MRAPGWTCPLRWGLQQQTDFPGIPWRRWARVKCRSFYVLHLLAHLFDQHLHVHGYTGERQGGGLGALGIGFSVEFLDQEVQALSNFPASVYQGVQFVEVGI